MAVSELDEDTQVQLCDLLENLLTLERLEFISQKSSVNLTFLCFLNRSHR